MRSSNEPYHYPDNGGIDMDLMNLPYGMEVHDSKHFIANVLYNIVRDLPWGVKMHLDTGHTVYNTVTFLPLRHGPHLPQDPPFCTWSNLIPMREGGTVEIKRLPHT